MSPEPPRQPEQQQSTARRGPDILMRATADGPHPLRVLVVDDEPSICRALEMLFRWHGIDAISAPSALDALAIIERNHIDVLLIDLRLRDARGDTVYRAAVERDASFRDRTLFMTGDITAEAERIIAATNCPYLRKPFDITLAVQAIAALVGVAYPVRGEAP